MSGIDDLNQDIMSDEDLLGRLTGKPKKKTNPYVVVFVYFPLLVAFAFGLGCWYAFAAMTMWNWFLVPLGVMVIGFWNMMGFGCLVGMFTVSFAKTYTLKRTSKEKAGDLGMLIISPAFALLLGWIYQMLM